MNTLSVAEFIFGGTLVYEMASAQRDILALKWLLHIISETGYRLIRILLGGFLTWLFELH